MMPVAQTHVLRPDGVSGSQAQYKNTATNPKRRPAKSSVSLRQSAQSLMPLALAENSIEPPSVLAREIVMDMGYPAPLQNHVSNASNWFDNANANIDTDRANSMNSDPPFYIDQPHGEGTRSSDSARKTRDWVGNGLTSSLLRREDSENGDLRSVIDDLTIENKRLKQRLQRYERFHHPDLQQDKLFEVRINGLLGQKKRELEELLRHFTTGLTRSATVLPFSPQPDHHVSSSRHLRSIFHSNSQLADSAYASMTQSLSGSFAQSNQGKARNGPSIAVKDRNIRSYLHDIPETLLPIPTRALTEDAKMKEIVKRLEQLFTGKPAAPGEHSFPNQQQEVSHSAAHADAIQKGNVGEHRHAESNREALIMPEDSKPAMQRADTQSKMTQAGHDQRVPVLLPQSSTDSSSSDGNSPGQRPTRPLDLDIHRAQVPAENIAYIRHLGLSYPNSKAGRPSVPPDNWVYLNLLISMAQLHTINVTPKLIRKAIVEKSLMFDLSEDGHKIRWKGGIGATRLSSERSGAEAGCDESPIERGIKSEIGNNSCRVRDRGRFNPMRLSGSRSVTKSYGRSALTSGRNNTGAQIGLLAVVPTTADNKFDYKPLFFNGHRPDYDDESGLGEGDSMNSSSGQRITAGGLERESDTFGRRRPSAQIHDDGLIIFYHNSTFCADLSGDSLEQLPNVFPATQESKRILGVEASYDEPGMDFDDFKGPLVDCSIRPGAVEYSPVAKLQVFEGAVDNNPSPTPILKRRFEFEASGVGGVLPADNFALDVNVTRTPASHRSVESRPTKRRRFNFQSAVTQFTQLPPSNLPPPSFIFLPIALSSSSDGDSMLDPSSVDEGGDDDDESMASGFAEQQSAPRSFLRNFSSEDNADASSNARSDRDDVSSDSSMDLLNTARALDPETIADQEREFDSHVRTLDELSAGSWAATVDGRSELGSSGSSGSERGSPSEWSVRPMPSSWSDGRPMSWRAG